MVSDESGKPALQLHGRYIQFVAEHPKLAWLAVTAAVTAVITLSAQKGLTAGWGWVFPGKPSTKIVVIQPYHGAIERLTMLTRLKPDPTCYRFSLRVESRFASTCVLSPSVHRDPCEVLSFTTGLLAICYDTPWSELVAVAIPKREKEPPKKWRDYAAKAPRSLKDPLAIELSNGQRCIHMPFPSLEHEGAPPDSTYVCDKTESPPIARSADGFVYGPLVRGRVWSATYVAVGSRLGKYIDIRKVWTT
jgi:hypothetical protein